jgi:para-aminobenzoate synthetase component I
MKPATPLATPITTDELFAASHTDAAACGPWAVLLDHKLDVPTAIQCLAHLQSLLVLDSAAQRPGLGRYSFVTAAPKVFSEVWSAQFGVNPLDELEQRQFAFGEVVQRADLPPFQGGLAGLISYDLGQAFEKLPAAQHNEFTIPVVAAGLYDWTVAWDHQTRQCWIIATGWPESDLVQRREQALQQINRVRGLLAARPSDPQQASFLANANRSIEPISPFAVAPARLPGRPLFSNFTADQYRSAVKRVKEYIIAGDIFQANLTQRLITPAQESPLELFQKLRVRNPAPFSGCLIGSNWSIVSASPERFLKVEPLVVSKTDGANRFEVSTRPIKGTRRRPASPQAEIFMRQELLESEKDRSENLMIVDLLRNDLSRVCTPGTIRVPQLCAAETYETVQHLVSEVRGRLSSGVSFSQLIAATWPGGSITGAPKVRAQEIIAELEPHTRGAYTGSLFFRSFGGAADSNLLIRTFVGKGGWWQCGVGGGIVADSDPETEYEETWHKAAGMLGAL